MDNQPPIDNFELPYLSKLPYIEIPLYGEKGNGKITLVDGDYDGEYFAQYRWRVNNMGYAYRAEWDIDKKKARFVYLHEEVLKVRPGYWRDHINRNKLDNRSCNLREVTPKESAANRVYTKRKREIAYAQ